VASKVIVWVQRATTFRRVVIIVYRHAHDVITASPVEIRPVTRERVADALDMESSERIEEFRGFLQRGDLGYYGYLDGKVVHRAWARMGPVRVATYHSYGPLNVESDSGYVHYCETAPSARGLGVYPAVLCAIVSDLHARGVREVTIATTLENSASRHGIEKAGFVESRRIELRILFGVAFRRDLPILDASAAANA
jgi:hypothetical protein